MNTIINVNGRQYDARTGKMLGKAPDPIKPDPQKPKVAIHNTTAKSGSILDGVSKPKAVIQPLSMQPATQNVAPQKTRKINNSNASRSLDIKPLRRASSEKPVKNAPVIHSTSAIAQSKVEHSATGRGLLIKRIPDSRLARAEQTAKSNVIQKFNASPVSSKPILSTALGVVKVPISNTKSHTANAIRSLHKPKLGHQKQTNQRKVFEHPAIANATNHKNPKIKKIGAYAKFAKKFQISPKIAGISAGLVAFIIIGSFFIYQNIPSVAMQVAASRAGFSGRLPSTTPAGFSFKGPIRYTKGNITVSFSSRTDDRNFVITQKPSDQTSESLLVSEISPSKKRYQTYHDRGLTVFIYNDGNATWVDKGVLYNILDNGSLSSDQVLSIAGSM